MVQVSDAPMTLGITFSCQWKNLSWFSVSLHTAN